MSDAAQKAAVSHGVIGAFVSLVHHLVLEQQDLTPKDVDFIHWRTT